jgi:CheY-like chemotaxis protein
MTPNLRILVVEDSEDIRFIMKTELEWMGYSVLLANDARTALNLLKNVRPDVIISDIQMPEIDGFELIRRIRSNPALAGIPAIALSGYGMEKSVHEALERGFTAHRTKPVEPAELNDLIQELVSPAKRRLAGA